MRTLKIASQVNNNLDVCSFEKLFREFYPALLRYCTKITRNQAIAEDIVQEKFIHLWEKRNEINIHSSYKSYLYTTVKNKAIDYLRTQYSKSFLSYDQAPLLTESETPLQLMESEEYSKLVTRAVESLPDKCFVVFSLKRYGELSRKEIAEKLNISEKTVDNHLAIATKKIRSMLLKFSFLQLLII